MRRTLFSLLLGSTLAVSAAAHAQRQPARPTATPTAAPQHFDFDDDEVAGTWVRPNDEDIDSRVGAKHSSLIRLRADFVPELVASAENL